MSTSTPKGQQPTVKASVQSIVKARSLIEEIQDIINSSSSVAPIIASTRAASSVQRPRRPRLLASPPHGVHPFSVPPKGHYQSHQNHQQQQHASPIVVDGRATVFSHSVHRRPGSPSHHVDRAKSVSPIPLPLPPKTPHHPGGIRLLGHAMSPADSPGMNGDTHSADPRHHHHVQPPGRIARAGLATVGGGASGSAGIGTSSGGASASVYHRIALLCKLRAPLVDGNRCITGDLAAPLEHTLRPPRLPPQHNFGFSPRALQTTRQLPRPGVPPAPSPLVPTKSTDATAIAPGTTPITNNKQRSRSTDLEGFSPSATQPRPLAPKQGIIPPPMRANRAHYAATAPITASGLRPHPAPIPAVYTGNPTHPHVVPGRRGAGKARRRPGLITPCVRADANVTSRSSAKGDPVKHARGEGSGPTGDARRGESEEDYERRLQDERARFFPSLMVPHGSTPAPPASGGHGANEDGALRYHQLQYQRLDSAYFAPPPPPARSIPAPVPSTPSTSAPVQRSPLLPAHPSGAPTPPPSRLPVSALSLYSEDRNESFESGLAPLEAPNMTHIRFDDVQRHVTHHSNHRYRPSELQSTPHHAHGQHGPSSSPARSSMSAGTIEVHHNGNAVNTVQSPASYLLFGGSGSGSSGSLPQGSTTTSPAGDRNAVWNGAGIDLGERNRTSSAASTFSDEVSSLGLGGDSDGDELRIRRISVARNMIDASRAHDPSHHDTPPVGNMVFNKATRQWEGNPEDELALDISDMETDSDVSSPHDNTSGNDGDAIVQVATVRREQLYHSAPSHSTPHHERRTGSAIHDTHTRGVTVGSDGGVDTVMSTDSTPTLPKDLQSSGSERWRSSPFFRRDPETVIQDAFVVTEEMLDAWQDAASNVKTSDFHVRSQDFQRDTAPAFQLRSLALLRSVNDLRHLAVTSSPVK